MTRDGVRAIVALLVVAASVVALAAPAAGAAAPGATNADATHVSAAGAVDASAAAQEDCSFPVTLTDAKGNDVTLEERPDSVVALQPSAAQTMWEIGAEGQVSGLPVSQYTEYLDGREDKTDISQDDGVSANIEAVVATEADLVLAPNSTPDPTIEQLRDVGMTVYEFRMAESIEDIYEKTNTTGRLTGNCEGAAETVDEMQTDIQVVQEAVSGEERGTVYYQMTGGFTAGEGTFINRIIELGGGENIAASANVTGYAQLSNEVVVDENPEWILVQEQFGLQGSEALSNTTAVREDQIIEVNANYLNQPAPRVVIPISRIAESIHPEAYAEANASVRAEAGTNGTADDAESSDGGGQPGMGVGAAVAALVATLALARRR